MREKSKVVRYNCIQLIILWLVLLLGELSQIEVEQRTIIALVKRLRFNIVKPMSVRDQFT